MTTGGVAPDEATFRRLARQRRVVPVVRRLLADADTLAAAIGPTLQRYLTGQL